MTAERRRPRRFVKSAELVALEIVRDIVARGLRAGDILTPEAEMVVQYGFSRPVIREALRLLEFQGLITIRPGPGAGTLVGHAQTEKLAQTLTLYLHLSEATYHELVDAWQVSESTLAWCAARNPDREKVRATLEPFMEDSACKAGDLHDRNVGRQFHETISDLAGNQVLSLSYRAISTIAVQHVTNNIPGEMLDGWIHDHSDIARAIIEGEAEKARMLMFEHIGHLDSHWRALWPNKVGERLKWTPTGPSPF